MGFLTCTDSQLSNCLRSCSSYGTEGKHLHCSWLVGMFAGSTTPTEVTHWVALEEPGQGYQCLPHSRANKQRRIWAGCMQSHLSMDSSLACWKTHISRDHWLPIIHVVGAGCQVEQKRLLQPEVESCGHRHYSRAWAGYQQLCLKLVQVAGEQHLLFQNRGVVVAGAQLCGAVNSVCREHASAGGVNVSSWTCQHEACIFNFLCSAVWQVYLSSSG